MDRLRFQFRLRDLFVATIMIGCVLLFWPWCGPEKYRMAKRAAAVNELRLAGLDVSGDELDAAGWQPGDDLATIRSKLTRDRP